MDWPRICTCTLLHTTHTLASTFIFSTSNFGAVAGELLVFVDIDFFYLNWFYFSTSWLIFLFLQFYLFFIKFLIWSKKKKKEVFLVFAVEFSKFSFSWAQSSAGQDQPERLCTTIPNPRPSTKPTNALAQALDAQAHWWSIMSYNNQVQLCSIT